MGLPWWIWVLAAVAAVFSLGVLAAARYRQSILDEFVGHLRRLRPDVEIVHADRGTLGRGAWLKIKLPSGSEGILSLAKLTSAVGEARAQTVEDRRPIMEHWVRILDDMVDGEHVDLATSISRLRPRVVRDLDYPADLFEKLPRRPLGPKGLSIVYVLDAPHSVAYVTNEQIEAASLDEPTLHGHALMNLRATFSAEPVREALEGKTVTIATGDTYDAARVLLIPENLADGEALAVLIPDRDTLMITSIPADSRKLRDLARTMDAAEPRLFDQPIRVSRIGFEVLT